MKPGGRLGDKAFCPDDGHGCLSCSHPVQGPAVKGSPNVTINNMPALRLGDAGIHASCCGPNTWKAASGSATVFINGKAAHRMGDDTIHCGGNGNLIEGSNNVFIGDGVGSGTAVSGAGAATDPQREVLVQGAEAGDPFCAVCEAEEDQTPGNKTGNRDMDREREMRKTAARANVPFMEKECPCANNDAEPAELSDELNNYVEKVIGFNYSKVGYLFLEGAGLHGSYRVKGYASIYEESEKWLLDVTVNITTAASKMANLDFSGKVELVVDGKVLQSSLLTYPKGPYISGRHTLTYDINRPFILPEKGEVEIQVYAQCTGSVAGGTTPNFQSTSPERIKIYEKSKNHKQ